MHACHSISPSSTSHGKPSLQTQGKKNRFVPCFMIKPNNQNPIKMLKSLALSEHRKQLHYCRFTGKWKNKKVPFARALFFRWESSRNINSREFEFPKWRSVIRPKEIAGLGRLVDVIKILYPFLHQRIHERLSPILLIWFQRLLMHNLIN